MLEGRGVGERSGKIAGALVEAAWDLPSWGIGAAARLELALAAIMGAATVEERGSVVDQGASGGQRFPSRTDIGVGALVVKNGELH